MRKRNGVPAFPRPFSARHDDEVYPAFDGMTLRDWFAGQALAGIMANHVRMYGTNGEMWDMPPTPDELADDAYHTADAMLRKRDMP